jgi:hypothetical protein
MIVHIFTASRYHLVPSLSKGFATVYRNDADHFFILYGDENLDKQLYVKQFAQIGFSNYVFCDSFWKLTKQLFQHREDALLFHAGNYIWHITALLLNYNNVNWVCWGGGTTFSNSWKSRIGGVFKKYTFNHFRSIVTLMEPERQQLIKNFGISSEKIRTISYVSIKDDESEFDLLCKNLLEGGSVNLDKPVVLLGNSHFWISSYIDMLHRLKQYKGKIKVQCMLNYEFKKTEKYQTLVSLGKSIFGDDFQTNEDFYSERADYLNYMNGCDIYICAVKKQTGLGAISACLRLGKKIYITGDNYEWAKQAYHSIVFPLETISDNLCFEEFVKPLSFEEKMSNYQNRVMCKAANREKWHHYLKEIDA